MYKASQNTTLVFMNLHEKLHHGIFIFCGNKDSVSGIREEFLEFTNGERI